jgi:hypothetical protein
VVGGESAESQIVAENDDRGFAASRPESTDKCNGIGALGDHHRENYIAIRAVGRRIVVPRPQREQKGPNSV